MPGQIRNRFSKDHSYLQDRSIHKDKSSRLHKPQKAQFLSPEYQQNHRKRERSVTTKERDRSQSKNTIKCSGCLKLKAKLKEKEDHFRQIMQIHHKEVQLLEKHNDQLREELQQLEERAKKAEDQLQKLKEEASYSSHIEGENHYDNFPSMSPIGEPKVLTTIKKLVSGQRSTLSELLVATPQGSQLGPSPFEEGQKENALRSEFQRLMKQCSTASNRSKKSILRKQLAAIANQLSHLQVDSVKQ